MNQPLPHFDKTVVSLADQHAWQSSCKTDTGGLFFRSFLAAEGCYVFGSYTHWRKAAFTDGPRGGDEEADINLSSVA